MSLSRASFASLRKAVSMAARRQMSTKAEQTFKHNPVADNTYMFNPKTWGTYFELLPLVGCTAFAASIVVSYMAYSLFKEDVRVNNSSALVANEAFHDPHRYKIINLHKDKALPEEVAELKKALGPYKAF